MTNEETIKRLKEAKKILTIQRLATINDQLAFDIAISALSKQCASREQADHIAEPDKMVKLKKRTITERMIIAKSLIDSVIADSDNDQFRDSTKKTDDVPDIHAGKTDFQPGDKFILELGAERRMFGEFEIKGTDLYVKTDLLEKLTRYEPEMKTEKIPYKKPEIIYCKDCQYRDPEDKKCDHGHGIVWQLPRPDDWFCADGKA